jgi:hypothetical protein
MEHMLGLLRFLETRQARRIAALLEQGVKGRAKLRAALAHDLQLDDRYASRISPQKQKPGEILSRLRLEGAPVDCYVLSEREDIDDAVKPLEAALLESVGSGFGFFLSCIPGRLAYFESENKGERFILKRS